MNFLRLLFTNLFNLSIENYISKNKVLPYNLIWNDQHVVLWTHLSPNDFKGSFIEFHAISDMKVPQYFSIRTDDYQQLKVFPKAFPSMIKGIVDFR